MLKGEIVIKHGVECPNCGYINKERKEHYSECDNCKTNYEEPAGNKSKLNDRVMPDVVLEEIKKYKYKCSNPYCGRWNKLAYMEHAKVVCEFCGIIAKTRKQA